MNTTNRFWHVAAAAGLALLAVLLTTFYAALRIGEAVNPSHYRYWHPTGTAATFGAAAAAGSLLGLTSEQMLDALGTAGTQAAGLWEFNADGAMSKHLHPGKAAFNGVLAADLARLGFTGATRILEGERGFFRATAAGFDPSRVTDRLGEQWKIRENCYKLHSCCAHTHTAIDVALDIRARRGWTAREALESIASVDLETYGAGYDIVKDPNPSTPYRAKFSIAYCTAAALLEGRVGLEQFSSDRFGDDGVAEPAIAALLPRVRASVRDDLTNGYPARWATNVVVTLHDGSVERGMNDFPRGNPEYPVSTEMLEDKFVRLIAPRYGDVFALRALDTVRSLGECADVAVTFHGLG